MEVGPSMWLYLLCEFRNPSEHCAEDLFCESLFWVGGFGGFMFCSMDGFGSTLVRWGLFRLMVRWGLSPSM